MPFAEAIKDARRKLGFSQQAMAEALGVSFSTVNRWEMGRHTPNLMTINAVRGLCRAHGIEFDFEKTPAKGGIFGNSME